MTRLRILRKRSGNGEQVDCVYADIRFVREGEYVEALRTAKTVRYCSAAKWKLLCPPRVLFEAGRLFARLPHLCGLRIGVALSVSRKAEIGLFAGMRGRHAHGWSLYLRLAGEHGDQP